MGRAGPAGIFCLGASFDIPTEKKYRPHYFFFFFSPLGLLFGLPRAVQAASAALPGTAGAAPLRARLRRAATPWQH